MLLRAYEYHFYFRQHHSEMKEIGLKKRLLGRCSTYHRIGWYRQSCRSRGNLSGLLTYAVMCPPDMSIEKHQRNHLVCVQQQQTRDYDDIPLSSRYLLQSQAGVVQRASIAILHNSVIDLARKKMQTCSMLFASKNDFYCCYAKDFGFSAFFTVFENCTTTTKPKL